MSNSSREGFETTLEQKVLPSSCMGCCSCIISCPFESLEYLNSKPQLSKECRNCGICLRVCPRYKFSILDLEKSIFGRSRRKNEDFGIYRDVVFARTTDESIRKVCQDGGVVTSLLVNALKERVIGGAAISGFNINEPLKAIPRLVTNKKGILECSGTRYSYSANLLAFKAGIQKKLRRIALVGTSCQINAIRRIQDFPISKYSSHIAFTLGLLCSESFSYDGLMNFITKELDINLDEAKRIIIKGDVTVETRSGEFKTTKLKEIKNYANFCKNFCQDFSAELADISLGGLGLDGWTLTVIRTKIGEDIFRNALSNKLVETLPAAIDSLPLRLLKKISNNKREKIKKYVKDSL